MRAVTYKPKVIHEYNKYMRHLDKYDQLLSCYSSEHKSVRWYKKFIIRILEIALVNAYQLYVHIKHTMITFHYMTVESKY